MKRGWLGVFVMFVLLSATPSHAGETVEVADRRAALQWITPAVEAVHVEHHVFRSDMANADVSYHLYVPEAYAREPKKRFPVLYWLHGTGNGWKGIPTLTRMFDAAMVDGRISPMLIVFPNGLRTGMWSDAKDGTAPIETLVVRELVAEIDANYRTIATREGRMIEGFSMGGYGAARLGFRYPDVFENISILAGGPLDQDLRGPSARRSEEGRARILREVYGGDIANFRAQSPSVIATHNRDAISGSSRIRQMVGERDALLEQNRALSAHLSALGIDHEFTVVPDVGHDPQRLIESMGDRFWHFYRDAFRAVR